MRRLIFKIVFLATVVAASSAQPADSDHSHHPELIEVQAVSIDADWLGHLTRYRLAVGVLPVYATDSMRFGEGFHSTPQLISTGDQKRERAWTTDSGWLHLADSDHPTLSPRLHIESNFGRIAIKPRRHSVEIEWSMALP